MTITDSGRLSEQEMARARELYASGVTSKDGLRKGLGVGWPKAAEALSRLAEEAERRRQDQRLERRSRLGKLRSRKSGPVRLPGRLAPLPQAPVSPAVVAVPAPPAETVPVEQPDPAPQVSPISTARPATWPLQLIALPAYVAIWAGWVALGRLTAFGSINLLPGIGEGLTINTAITLPIGAEAYAAYALYVLFHPGAPRRARMFAAWSAGAALVIGMGGQVAYHLMAAAGMTSAPWLITTFVSCLPVAVLGAAAALVYLIRAGDEEES